MVWVSKLNDPEYKSSKIVSLGIPVAVTGGLPRIIPTTLRRSIEREGGGMTLKVVLSILSLYRI